MDEIDQDDSSKRALFVPDAFGNLNDFLNTHKELQNCFSKLKIGYITEKELKKQQQRALENIKNIYEEVFGENSFRPLQAYSEEQMQELNNETCDDKNLILYGKTALHKSENSVQYQDLVEYFHKDSAKSEYGENSSRIASDVHGSCNKCKAMHPAFVKYFEDKTFNANIKCTNISKRNFAEWCKSHNNFLEAGYVDEMNSVMAVMHNNTNKKDIKKLKVCAVNESLCDNRCDINYEISKELSKLYSLKDTIKQLEEYDKQMNKKINEVVKIKQHSHKVKLNKSPYFEKKECLKKKVTVPEPFNLSQSKKSSKNKDIKPTENQETFHANPIPNHIYHPLYKELSAKEERKKERRAAASVRKLKTIVKPYNLSTNEYQKYKREFQSVPDLRDVNTHFKARPVPHFVYNHNLAEKKKEEEKKRQIRIKQRSESLLKQSALPFSERKITQKWKTQNLSKSLDDLNKNSEKKLEPELNNKIYNAFRKKTTTVCQPFYFKTEERHLNKLKNLKTLYENEYISCTACNTPKKIPFHITERPSSAPFSYPINKRTNSSVLRDHYVRQQIQIKQEEMERELQKLGEKHQRENCFFNIYGWKFKMLNSTEDVKKALQAKLKLNRKMALQRQHEYKVELKEMKERVHKRPLLIEMQAAISQKGRLEKCYHLALERAGVNTEFVEELSGRYKDWDNRKPHDTNEDEISSSDTLYSEQGSEINDNSQSSQNTKENSHYCSKDDDEHSSDVDMISHCSQQSVISNKELTH